MKGKIRSFTGQIGFYKVPEEMKNSLTYTSPFIDVLREITDISFHSNPPQDVFYHPIETRVDTTPPLFYYKVIFYDAYDAQIAETEWLTSSPTIYQPFYKAKIKIFHPYSNIRKFIVENRNFPDNTLLQSIEFSYNSSHLYEYLFTIDHNSMKRQIFIKAYRWEDTNPTTLWVQLISTAIFTKIEYSTDEAADPSILAQDWTAQGGSYTFGFVKTRLHYKSTVDVNIDGNNYSPSGSIDYNVHSGGGNIEPTKSYNLSTSVGEINTSKIVSITSNGLLAKVFNNYQHATPLVNEDRTVVISSFGTIQIYFFDLPSPNQNFTLYLGRIDFESAQAYIEAPMNSQRKRTILFNFLQSNLDEIRFLLENRQVISNSLSVFFEKDIPSNDQYPFRFYSYEDIVRIEGEAQRLNPNQTIANFSQTVYYLNNQWYQWNEYPNINAIYVEFNNGIFFIKINCPWGSSGDPVRYTFTFTRPPINNSPGVFTVSIYRSSQLLFSYAKYDILRLP